MNNSLEQLNAQIALCKKCPSMNNGQKRVKGTGAGKAKIFFLGEAPGRLGADQTGIPFTKDRSGKLLRTMLESVGISSEMIYISNVVKCNPRAKHGTNRRPSKEELINCREFLLEELILVQPKVIVPLGEMATRQFLTKKGSMKEINAKLFNHEKYGMIFPMFHPGYLVRGNYSLVSYEKDFLLLAQVIK